METLRGLMKADPKMLVGHHINSYNTFINHGIRSIVLAMGPTTLIDEKCTLRAYVGGEDASDIRLEWLGNVEPSISSLRLKNHSYTRNVMADIHFVAIDAATGEQDTWVQKDVRLGSLPVMTSSVLCVTHGKDASQLWNMGECPFDLGGYFIIDGKEKVIVSQERGVLNRVFVEKNKDDTKYSFTAFSRCVSTIKKMPPKTMYMHVISSKAAGGRRANAVLVDIPGRKKITDVPLFLLFRALGKESDKAILECIVAPGDKDEDMIVDFFRPSIVDGNVLFSQKEALDFLKEHVQYTSVQNMVLTLMDDFLPQTREDLAAKATTLGCYCKKLAQTCLGLASETDRDNFMHKRISTSGFLISDLFQKYYEQFWIRMNVAIDNEYRIIYKNNYSFPFLSNFVTPSNNNKLFDKDAIQDGMRKSFKGAWGIMENITYNTKELGIIQDLSRISYMAFLSHLRRVASPLDDKAKVIGPHMLSGSQWGLMCPCESPDGRNVGLLKNLALTAHITDGGMSTKDVIAKLSELLGSELNSINLYSNAVRIFANDVLVGCVFGEKLDAFRSRLMSLRDSGFFGAFASIAQNRYENEVHVRTDDGRICRPLFRVNEEGSVGDVVYVDVEEINSSAYIAMEKTDILPGRHSHCEIHPCCILSVYTNTIPFADHNQANRNTFSGSQGKQAIGIYATNLSNRIDTAAYVLHYPQRPIVETSVSKCFPASGILNNGENAIVAVACYSGYNMEDAVILNKASVDRGMFSTSLFKTLFAEEEHEQDVERDTRTSTNIVFSPNEEALKLDERGLPKVGAYVVAGEVAVGRTRFVDRYVERRVGDFLSNDNSGGAEDAEVHDRTDISVMADQNHNGFVDRVFAERHEDKGFCKIRLRQLRMPDLGDKMASRHGQKGVIGALMLPEDMPHTADGLIPDMIINPHAFPSRMTVGHLLESIAAKSAILEGQSSYDGTPFQRVSVASIGSKLAAHGYRNDGNEIMYNGSTGEQMKTSIFIGPTYYCRLKHMVKDKVNSRAGDGTIVGLTGQPTKGRANNGGMRVGEMERDAIMAHGMAAFMKESFSERSDGKTKFPIQNGDFTFKNPDRILVGRDNTPVSNIKCPGAFKLLTNELKAFHIDVKLS